MNPGRPFAGKPSIEPLPAARTRGFFVKSFRKPCVDFHWHFHPEFELIVIRQGRGVLYAGRSLVPYSAGDMFLLGSCVPHAYGSHPGERTGACWTVMHFLPGRWGREFWMLPQNHRVRRLLDAAGRGIRFRGSGTAACASLLGRLEKGAPSDVAMALWIELLERLARNSHRHYLNTRPHVHAGGAPMDRRLQKILVWLDETAHSASLTQAGAARLLGMSPQAFSRFFRHQTGRVFRAYVNELRVARACSSLLETGQTVGEIAFGSGFNNLANFNRRFLEIAGCTPGAYRRSRGGLDGA